VPTGRSNVDYIEAAGASSRRARLVLIVLVTASIVEFAAFWNSRQGSWIHARQLRVSDALKFRVWSNPDPNLPSDDKAKFDKAKMFADLRGINSKQALENLSSELQKIRSEEVDRIRLPFFGSVFDVNDLGILGGITFVIVLIWFRFSLLRECNNLDLVFEEAKKRDRDRGHEELQRCYDLVGMQQVLTLPRIRGKHHAGGWAKVPRVLSVFPVLVYLAVCINDGLTWKHGISVSLANTVVLFAVEITCFLLIVILTYMCVDLSWQIDKTWNGVAKILGL
jgi:hypothetical protein